MKTVVAFIALLIININLAQSKHDKIEGVIRDGETNLPVENCMITLFKSDSVYDTKFTSVDGKFEFFRLDSGSYVLQVEKSAFVKEERKVVIKTPNKITHSFTVYLDKDRPIAQVNLKEIPQKSNYEYFLMNHVYAKYETDSTTLFSSSGDCKWNEKHEMLYVGVLYLDIKANGEVEILGKTKLLGAFEVMPDIVEPIAEVPEEKKGKKLLSALEKMAEVAGKVITENSGVVLK